MTDCQFIAQRFGREHLDDANDKGERIVTVLDIPPVESPLTAVRSSIMADAKGTK